MRFHIIETKRKERQWHRVTDNDRKRQNRGWSLISSACRRFVVFEMETLCRRSFKCISTAFLSTSLTTSHAQMPGKGIVALFPCPLCSIIYVIAILDATTHLYMRSCPSVRPSVCPALFSNDEYGRF